MSIQVPPAGPQDPAALAAVRVHSRTDGAGPAEQQPSDFVAGATVDTLPGRPPAEVLREIEAASRRYDELRSQQRELHFTRDPSRNRVIIEVRDLEGNVLRTIPPSKALGVIAGGAVV